VNGWDDFMDAVDELPRWEQVRIREKFDMMAAAQKVEQRITARGHLRAVGSSFAGQNIIAGGLR
jgi:hypothetical protein